MLSWFKSLFRSKEPQHKPLEFSPQTAGTASPTGAPAPSPWNGTTSYAYPTHQPSTPIPPPPIEIVHVVEWRRCEGAFDSEQVYTYAPHPDGELPSTVPILGIDLGTTNCVVAVCRDGKVEVIPNHEGER